MRGKSANMDLEQQPALRQTGFHDPPHTHSHDTEHAHSHDAPHSHSHDHDHDHSSHSHSDPSSSHAHSHHGGATILSTPRKRYKPTEYDMDKLRSTMKQFVRDWSVEVYFFSCLGEHVVCRVLFANGLLCGNATIRAGKGGTRSRVWTYERSPDEALC